MLRLLVGLLVAANLLFLAWSQGWLSPWLLDVPPGDAHQREPRRVAAQVAPAAVVILDAKQAEALSRLRCVQAGPLEAEALALAEEALRRAEVPGLTWQVVPAPQDRHWLRVDAATEAQHEALRTLAEPALGDGFDACP